MRPIPRPPRFRLLLPGLTLMAVSPLPGQSQAMPESSQVVEEDGYDGLTSWARDYLERLAPAAHGAQDSLPKRVERIKAIYFLGVEETDWVSRGRDSLAVAQVLAEPGSDPWVALRAYEGALEVLRAKHSRWPPNKLKFLKAGSEILDDLVVGHPENLQVRFLRYASYRALPFFLSRDEAVLEDLGTLVRGLPEQPEAFSSALYAAVLRFLLDNASLAAADMARLEAALSGRGRP